MEASHLLLVCITYIFSNINQASSYESLAVLKNLPSSTEVSLPIKAIEKDIDIMYPEVEEGGKSITFLCPHKPDTTRYSKDLALLITPQYEYCLFPCEGRPYCAEKIKPLFSKDEGNSRYTKCPGSQKYEYYHMGFNYCRYKGTNENDTRRITSQQFLSLYDVCFDTDHSRTVWTRHNVQTPSMFQGEGLKSQQMNAAEEEKFNEDPFTLPNKKVFSNAAEMYKNQPDTPYKMIPQMIVPQEHMALRIWKETTTHYVNTAPLWDKLVPLMKAINDGIRKAAITTYFEARSADLDIYTTWEIESNIWCKVIHHWSYWKGIMIFLHNSPGNPPANDDPATRKSNPNSIPKQCKVLVPCDFRKWSDEPESLSDEILQYAYCCRVDDNQVKKLFSLDYLYNLAFLDIEDRIIRVNDVRKLL